MKIKVEPGRYVVAVSGGVDSMALLDLLSAQPGLELIVAHFNHGIRPDSAEDEALVRATAKPYGYSFEVGYGELGPSASEAEARDARYSFLTSTQKKYSADAIITAHHQDDLIETVFINILRGTGPRGLISLADTQRVKRPLLGYSKQEILVYAKSHRLKWRDDPSNENISYLRNYIRKTIMPRLNQSQRVAILSNIEKVAKSQKLKSEILATFSHVQTDKYIDRQFFSTLPSDVAAELLADWLRNQGCRDFDRKSINRLNVAVRTARAGTTADINDNSLLKFDRQKAYLINR